MLRCDEFHEGMKERAFTFYAGVPDSTFDSLIECVHTPQQDVRAVTTANEGEAIAMCAGHYLSTGRPGVAYMQNDGLGNCVNPLTSLCNDEVYGLPLLLLVGWRGKPGTEDSPQHNKMGEILLPLLDLLDIEHEVLPKDTRDAERALDRAVTYLDEMEEPYALIIEPETFEPTRSGTTEERRQGITREEAVRRTDDCLDGDELLISTTGKLSRELYEYREHSGQGHTDVFYNVGAMGWTGSLGLGVAFGQPHRSVVVLDGDGSVLMQLGSLATRGCYAPDNFLHVVFDNEAHDSTGGQPTCSGTVSLSEVAAACKYTQTETIRDPNDLEARIKKMQRVDGPSMCVVKVDTGARPDLGRPSSSPQERKTAFMRENVRDAD